MTNRKEIQAVMVMSFSILAEWDWSIPEVPSDSWLVCAIALIILMFFIWAIARLTSSANEGIDPAEMDRQMLTAVTDLKSRGELTADEYRSIKGRLVNRLSDRPDAADSDESSENNQHPQEKECESQSTTETPEGTTVSDKTESGESPSDVGNRISEKD